MKDGFDFIFKKKQLPIFNLTGHLVHEMGIILSLSPPTYPSECIALRLYRSYATRSTYYLRKDLMMFGIS